MTEPATAWSYSRWDTWRQCPLKYKLMHLDKISKEQTPAMARGNRIHLQLAAFLEGRAGLPVEIKEPSVIQIAHDMQAFPQKIVEEEWGFNAQWNATTYFGKDIWLRSILDVALFYDDMEIEAIDWKTGKRYSSNDDQMELFATTVLSKFRNAVNVVTRLVYVDQKDQQEIQEFPRKDHEKLMAKWAELARPMLADRTWPARPNDKCGWCEFGRAKGGQCVHG